MFYKKIYIIGEGSTAFRCAKLFYDLNIDFEFIEYLTTEHSFIKKSLVSLGIKYNDFDFSLSNIVNQHYKTIIFSISNKFIFPDIFINKNIDIINYHNSLLPKHRGMNAEAWSIYEGDKETGVTLHFIDKGIDTGDIIFQTKININNDITSLNLLKKQSDLVIYLLEKNIKNILNRRYKIKIQNQHIKNKIHYKREIPNNGILDITWDESKIWNFLRAMDYGPFYKLGYPKIKYMNKWFSWKRYKKIDNFSFNKKQTDIFIKNRFLLKDIFEVN